MGRLAQLLRMLPKTWRKVFWLFAIRVEQADHFLIAQHGWQLTKLFLQTAKDAQQHLQA